jgi:hypothetical protein
VAVKAEAFLALEKSLSTKLHQSWHKHSARQVSRIAKHMAAGEFDDAYQAVDQLDYAQTLEGHKRYLEFVGLSAALYGAREFGEANTLSISRDKTTPKQVKQSAHLLRERAFPKK